MLAQIEVVTNLAGDVNNALREKLEEAVNDEQPKVAAQYKHAISYLSAALAAFRRSAMAIESLPE